MKKKLLMSLLTTVMFLSVSSLCDAEAASKVVDDYSLKEVTANLTSESVSVTDYNGNPLGVDVSGPYDENRDYTVKALVDGYEGSWAGIASVNERNEKHSERPEG